MLRGQASITVTARAAAGLCLPLWERPVPPRAEPFAFQEQPPDVPSERTAERAKSDVALGWAGREANPDTATPG